MTKRIFRCILTACLITLACSLILIIGALYHYFGEVQKEQLSGELSLLAELTERHGIEELSATTPTDLRVTYVKADGTVVYDSIENAATMENHGNREEIVEAFETGSGDSSRYSSTLLEETLYRAKRLTDGTVLRISVSRSTILSLVLGMLYFIIIIAIIAIVISLLLAHRMAKTIARPLGQLDLNQPLENETYDELSPVLTHIEQQKQQIATQEAELIARKKEFGAVISNMKEGLVLISSQNKIMSINLAAANFFGTSIDSVGREFLTIDRTASITSAMELAKKEGSSELLVSRHGKYYQIDISKVGEYNGLVMLILDVTESVLAEQQQREFTSNVSHELKTPLQGISSCAELLEEAELKPEDAKRFIGHIRSEVSRMVTLVGDIIRLSQLEEANAMELEQVDLYDIIEEERKTLTPIAIQKNITITVDGKPNMLVTGTHQLLQEIVHNLMANAVQYNIEGGKVLVTLQQSNKVQLTVQDTGIGIPMAEQPRVFERFYRVDKSHSKATGGTGLGLSIVKHAVHYLGGAITLTSEEGKGTTVTVTF